ncbi:MAG TPA: TetR/AcrR family transcriptional regulator [Homoserinimonas sp.]|nr:TetR/AcrR family transcriptional regulator [Homoserinimonas sp.]
MSPKKATTPRKPVTRERAVQRAVAVADAGGIGALSMRKLAADLGVEAMSLYYHFKSKDDLIDGMIETVVGEMALPSSGMDAGAALRERAETSREVLVRHPWAIALLDARTTQATLRHHDAMIGTLREAGFSMPMVGHALSIIDSYVRGFAMQEVSLPLDETGDIGAATESIMEQQQRMSEEFPHLTERAMTLVLQPGYAYGNEFEFGLQLILDGLENRTQ